MVFALSLAEFLLLGFAVRSFGLSLVVVVTLASSLAGLAVLRRQIPALLRASGAMLAPTDGVVGIGAADGSDTDAAADRVLLSAAGLGLLVPGLGTSAAGVLLLVPPIRAAFRAVVRDRLARAVPSRLDLPFFFASGRSADRRRSSGAGIVDVDVVTEDEHESAPPELH